MADKSGMGLEIVEMPTREGLECIVGQGNFTVKTIDELYTLLYSSSSGIKFGVAMNEAKPKLARVVGNDKELKELAAEAAVKIGAGHVFVVLMKDAYPIHVLNNLKHHPCIVSIYAATSNPLQVIVASTELGRSVIGVVDGTSAEAAENEKQREERRGMVRKFGFLPE